MKKEILGEAITTAIGTFQQNELAFLALQGKIELQLRDKIAWYLQQNLPNLQNLPAGVEYVRKEFGIGGRSKCDLALLDGNMKPLCLIEFKAHSSATDEHKPGTKSGYYAKCATDIAKMKDMENALKKQPNSPSIQKFYVFFQTTHEGTLPNDLLGNTMITYFNPNVIKGYNALDGYLKSNSGNTVFGFIQEQWESAKYNDLDKENSFHHQENYAGCYYGLDVKIHSMIIECK